MMTPTELAEIARESDEYAEQFPGGISVELGSGAFVAFTVDGLIHVNGSSRRLTPAQVRALLHGIRLLDATSDLEPRMPWRPGPDAWKRGGAE